MSTIKRFLVVLTLAGPLGSGYAAAAEPIQAKEFQQLRALIKPHQGEEKWAQIPWLTSLWEARQRAAAEGKPILLWEMDGNPLGCT
jgi:hypothetical protein